eukprot:TRINITY_DN9349_c0_g1_i1.p1 TRINITY_DN9349_c0_g1~~TRINITY_DN9349_c0_g1_i1.p1  ORF type:complete len:522 (+),score=108.46 TRINITY_DN9349_c0_g1_i1:38-1603(+)
MDSDSNADEVRLVPATRQVEVFEEGEEPASPLTGDSNTMGEASVFIEAVGRSHPQEDIREARNRSHFTDWMRSISIYLVVLVHIFVSIPRVVPLTSVQQAKIDATFRVLMQFGLPMFFYFSGRSAAFSRDKPLQFVYKKVLRLLLPLFFGMLLVVIPTAYIGRKYRPCAPADMDNFFQFFADYFPNQFPCGGFEWLWFLPVLFALSIINLPLFLWMRRRYARPDFTGYRADVDQKFFLVFLACFLAAAVGFIILGLPLLWYVVSVALPYGLLVAVTLNLHRIRQLSALELVFVNCVIPSLLMAIVLDAEVKISRLLAMFFFYNLHFVEGFVGQLFYDEYRRHKQTARHLALRPVALFLLVCLLALCNPGTEEGVGYVFNYPLYTDRWFKLSYVAGTWVWIAVFVRWGQTFYNEFINAFQYNHVLQSSIVVYVVHWLFIETLLAGVIRPLGCGFVLSVAIEVPGTVLLCWGFYVLVLKVPYLGLLFGFQRSAVVVAVNAANVAPEQGIARPVAQYQAVGGSV